MRRFPKIILIMVLTLLPAFSGTALSGTIEGPATVRFSPNGPILFFLNDGAGVTVLEKEGDWYRISVRVALRMEGVHGFYIKPGQRFLSENYSDGGETGISFDEVQILNPTLEKDGWVIGEINGFVFRDNLKRIDVLIPSGVDMITGDYVLSRYVDQKDRTYSISDRKRYRRSTPAGIHVEEGGGWYGIWIGKPHEEQSSLTEFKRDGVLRSNSRISSVRFINHRTIELTVDDKTYRFLSTEGFDRE